MSNTGMTGSIVVKAIVLTSAQRPLISMSQLDDAGCYVTMGGGGMTIKRGFDQPTFLDLSRFDPEKHSLTTSSEVAAAGSKTDERQSLYSIPLDLFQVRKGHNKHGSVPSVVNQPMQQSVPIKQQSTQLADAWKKARELCLSGQKSPREAFVRNGQIDMRMNN